MRLDTLFNEFKKNALGKSFLVIIGSTAKGERKLYNSRRISTIVSYFLERGLEKQRIIFAEAHPIDKFGYITIYINGQLWAVMKSNPKKGFCTNCCEEPDLKVTFKQRSKKN